MYKVMLFIPYFLEIMKQVQIEQQVLTSRSGENLCNRKSDDCIKLVSLNQNEISALRSGLLVTSPPCNNSIASVFL